MLNNRRSTGKVTIIVPVKLLKWNTLFLEWLSACMAISRIFFFLSNCLLTVRWKSSICYSCACIVICNVQKLPYERISMRTLDLILFSRLACNPRFICEKKRWANWSFPFMVTWTMQYRNYLAVIDSWDKVFHIKKCIVSHIIINVRLKISNIAL